MIALVVLYNGFVQKRNRVDNAWAQIDVQLRRRDLIPNLVETVKGYAAHERGTFEAVTEARRGGGRGTRPRRAPEGLLAQALGRLFAVAEAYPELKANDNFRDLQAQLDETEDKIAVSRQVYNDTVLPTTTRSRRSPPCSLQACSASEARVLRARGRGHREVAGGQLPAARRRGPAPRSRRSAALLVAALALACPARCGNRSTSSGGRPRAGRERRLARRRGADPVAFSGSFTSATATSRFGAASRSTDVSVREGALSARRVAELGRADRRDVRRHELGGECASSGTTWHRRGAHVRDPLPLRGLAVAYDDVVDVNLKVWGDEWEERSAC